MKEDRDDTSGVDPEPEESLIDMGQSNTRPKRQSTSRSDRDTATMETEQVPKPREIKNNRSTVRWIEGKLGAHTRLLDDLERARNTHRVAINTNSHAAEMNRERLDHVEGEVNDIVSNLQILTDFLLEFKTTIFNIYDGKMSATQARRQSEAHVLCKGRDKGKGLNLRSPPRSRERRVATVEQKASEPEEPDADEQQRGRPKRQSDDRNHQSRQTTRQPQAQSTSPPAPPSSSSSSSPSRPPSRPNRRRHSRSRRSRRRSRSRSRSRHGTQHPRSPTLKLPNGYQLAVLDPALWLRQAREGTADTTSGDKIRIKKEDIGQFNPHGADSGDEGVVGSGKDIVYTDVDCFLDRLETFREDPQTSVSADKQLAQLFITLLAGPASYWWTDQLTSARRRELRTMGISAMLEALRDRFPPDPALSTKKFTDSQLRLKDIAADDTALEKHLTKKMRLAKGMGILESNHSNWYGTVMTIWSTWPKEVRQYVRPPVREESLDGYLQRLSTARTLVVAAAKDAYPWVKPATEALAEQATGQDSRRWRPKDSRSDGYRNSRRDGRGDRRGYRDNRRDDRDRGNRGSYKDRRQEDKPRDHDRSRDHNRDRDRNRDRNRDRDGFRNRDGARDGKDRDRRGKDRSYREKDRAHYAGSAASDGGESTGADAADQDASSASDNESNADLTHLILDRHLTCHRCHETFESTRQKLSHLRTCTPFRAVQMEGIRHPSPTDLGQRTCGYCLTVLPTRNLLFKHLKLCENAKTGSISAPAGPTEQPQLGIPSSSPMAADDPDEPSQLHYQIKEAPHELTKDIDKNILSSYTHLRTHAYATPADDCPPVEICIDPGTGRTFVGRTFLNTLEHTIEPRRGSAKGIGGCKRTEEWATFFFFLAGSDSAGVPTKTKITKSGWVKENLDPNLLLGNDFLAPYGSNIRYDDKAVDLNAIDLSVPFRIETRSKPCVRKVRTTRDTVLLPGQKAHIPTDYKPLPTDRNFAFEAKHGAIVNSIVDAKRHEWPSPSTPQAWQTGTSRVHQPMPPSDHPQPLR